MPGYREEQDSLPYVRGRVLMQESLRGTWAGTPTVTCEYEELSVSVDDNHIKVRLCRFFLEQSGPALGGGDHSLLPFTLHMPTFFESFVGRWLQSHLPAGIHLTTQHHANLEPSGNLHFKIDLDAPIDEAGAEFLRQLGHFLP